MSKHFLDLFSHKTKGVEYSPSGLGLLERFG
jgi:hypothetical protein